MRIATWNIGQYFWMMWAHHIGALIDNRPIVHQFFHEGNAKTVQSVLEHIQAEVVVFQELTGKENYVSIDPTNKYPYKELIPAHSDGHHMGIFSQFPITDIDRSHPNGCTLSSCITNGFRIVPIHLHPTSHTKRLSCIHKIIEKFNTTPKTIILGDTNVWCRGSCYLNKGHRQEIELLNDSFTPIFPENPSTTPVQISFDKIFITNDISYENKGVVKKNGHYMDHYLVWADVISSSK